MSEKPATESSGFSHLSLEDLRKRLSKFADERDWQQYHTPRNLVLALTGEIGELAEIFQWRGEVTPGCPDFKPEEREHLGEELSDCLLYLVRLADRCGVDLSAAALSKLEKNARKYPAPLCRGKNDKYTAYAASPSASAAAAATGDVTGSDTKDSAGSSSTETAATSSVRSETPALSDTLADVATSLATAAVMGLGASITSAENNSGSGATGSAP